MSSSVRSGLAGAAAQEEGGPADEDREPEQDRERPGPEDATRARERGRARREVASRPGTERVAEAVPVLATEVMARDEVVGHGEAEEAGEPCEHGGAGDHGQRVRRSSSGQSSDGPGPDRGARRPGGERFPREPARTPPARPGAARWSPRSSPPSEARSPWQRSLRRRRLRAPTDQQTTIEMERPVGDARRRGCVSRRARRWHSRPAAPQSGPREVPVPAAASPTEPT